MIKINLLQQRKVRRASAGPKPVLLISIASAIGVLAIVFVAVHLPLSSDVSALEAKNKDLAAENRALEQKTKNSRAIRQAFESEMARQQATERLRATRVTPAWLMNELSNILTPGKQPQLTPTMREELKENPNRPWQDGWDPKHVWITRFEEKEGVFELHGGAQAKGDVIELGLRLQASMFFQDVSPANTDDVEDKDTGLTYHLFEMTGKVRY